MEGYTYVYILVSEGDPDRFYVGLTEDLAARLAKHNSGSVPHTKKFRPLHIKTAVAFRDRKRAAEFEAYLKSASGRAFSKKRLRSHGFVRFQACRTGFKVQHPLPLLRCFDPSG